MAATIISQARSLEYYDRWIAAAEARQRAALREIDYRREIARRLRAAIEDLRDAEFAEVTDPPSKMSDDQ